MKANQKDPEAWTTSTAVLQRSRIETRCGQGKKLNRCLAKEPNGSSVDQWPFELIHSLHCESANSLRLQGVLD